jgi:hypothetical protein
MRRLTFLLVLAVAFVPAVSAQTALGAYADYFPLRQTNTNFAGLGGRLAFSVLPHVKLAGGNKLPF